MKIEITDEMVRDTGAILLGRANAPEGEMHTTARVILETFAPIIADMALERAAEVADKFAAEDRALAAKHRTRGEWIAVDELSACANEAEAVAGTIRALKEPTP